MDKKVHFIVTVVVSAALLAGCSQPEEAVPQNMSSQEEGSGKSTSEVQSITSSEISMVGQPEKGAAVYTIADINPNSLMGIYRALGTAPTDRVAIGLSTEESGSNCLRIDLIDGLVQSLQVAIVECNTVYGGARSNTAMHYRVTEDHGYTATIDIDIMDEDGSVTLPVTGGTNLTEDYVGEHFSDYDYYVILSHFKNHTMVGFRGAIKNTSIGLASAEDKNHIHTAGKSGGMWSAPQDPFLESVVEAGKSVADALNGDILYINVMSRLSVDCDYDTNSAGLDMRDIEILVPYGPVALDQACVNLVYVATDRQSLVNRIESRNGTHTLEQAERIRLGSRTYTLVNPDKQETKMATKIIFQILELK